MKSRLLSIVFYAACGLMAAGGMVLWAGTYWQELCNPN